MVQNQGGVALEQALTLKKWSHGELRRQMKENGKDLANGMPGKWIAGVQTPNAKNRVWMLEKLGIPMSDWDVPVLKATKRKSVKKAS